ncbi:hypothetical protein DFH09DRAFT_1332633 [Mycena vulgaris]|nr:hypothetical protein DFH09DRAFT_1332633 [Mycena vulgaris]
MIRCCTDTAFHTLQFTFDASPTAEVTREFSTALAQCGRSHASLRSLIIRNTAYDPPDLVPEMFLVRNEAIQHLFCFGNLTKIEVVSPCGFELNDRTCALMTRTWMYAECITLEEYSYSPEQSATLESLRSFARHCPSLNKLRITFDARVVPGPEDPQPCQLNLEHLDISHSLINSHDPRPAARFISSIFPHLKFMATADDYRDLDGYEEDAEEDAPHVDFYAWQEVEELLPVRRAMCAR